MDDLDIMTRKDALADEMASIAAELDAEKDNHGVVIITGKPHMANAKGHFVPLDAIKDEDSLEDQLVRKVIGYALPLAAEVARFRQHCFDDVDAFIALLDEKYQVKRGGQKGNMTFTSYDGLLQVKVAVAEHISYGPQLQQAKSLIDECLVEWTATSRASIRAIIDDAFQVDQEGKINRSKLLGLRRIKEDDPRFLKAMQLVADAERVIGSKRYVRAYYRAKPTDAFQAIVIDVAAS